MVSLNRVIIAGNLTRDPETKETSGGKQMTIFPVAVNKRWRGNDGENHKETTYFKIIVWNTTARNCARFLKKGKPVLVEGRLETRVFKNNAGQTQYLTQIVGDQVTFLNKCTENELGGDDGPAIM